MNEDQIVARAGGLGGIPMANPEGSVAQATQGGLGRVGSPVREDGYARNSSLAMFEVANAEKQRAKEMQFENEALRARGEQMRLNAENSALKDNEINMALKSGQLDEATAVQLLQDRNVSDATKQNIANVFYPVRAMEEVASDPDDMNFYGKDGVSIPESYNRTDEAKQDEIYAQSRAAGKPGIRNVNWQ